MKGGWRGKDLLDTAKRESNKRTFILDNNLSRLETGYFFPQLNKQPPASCSRKEKKY